MIAVLRKLTIITILFGIILFIQSIQVETFALVSPKTLAVLGFLILASFTLGEILSIVGLPRVIGYLLIGIIFGPYANILFGNEILKVFDQNVITDLSLVNAITLSVIALTAGMELQINDLKKIVKPISVILGLKTVFIFLLVPITVFSFSSFIPFLAAADWKMILSAGLLLSVIAMGTSIELTLVVASEAKAKGRFIDLILSTSIVKDVLVILLLALCLTISNSLLNPSAEMDIHMFTELGLELLLSVLFGALLGVLVILYLRYINKELLLFIFSFIVVGSAVSSELHLETLIVFITTGFVIRNFSDFGEKFHPPLSKLALPIFITFFTVAGASINILSIQATIIIGLILAVVRGIALFFSVRYASKICKESEEILEYGWMGFLSIGGLMLGLGILIEQKLPGFGGELKTIITSLVALNLFLGPVFLKVALARIRKNETIVPEELSDISDRGINSKQDSKSLAQKFKEPDLQDQTLNKSIYQILFKLNQILQNFDRKFILLRSEESLELIIGITEKYTDDYLSIMSNHLGEGKNIDQLRGGLLEIQNNLDQWYLNFCNERKTVEKGLLKLEPLIKDLFFSLTDLTDSLKTELTVELEKEKYIPAPSDNILLRVRKYFYLSKMYTLRLFNNNFRLSRKIEYRNLAKYYLVGQSAGEILETVNLVGSERLTTLRKIRTLFNDYSKNLSELRKITMADKPEAEILNSITEKLQSMHGVFVNELKIYTTEITNTTEEISSRLTYALANPFNHFVDTLKIAGTYEFKSRKIRFSKIFAQSEIKKDTALDTIRYWINYYTGFIGLFEKEIFINQLKINLEQVVNNSLVKLSEEISKNLRSAGRELTDILVQLNSENERTKKNSPDEYVQVLKDLEERLLSRTLDGFIANLENIRRGKGMNKLIESMIHDFSTIANSFPEEIALLEEKDFKLEKRIPLFRNLKNIPIKKICSGFLEKKLPRSMGDINELLLNHLNFTLLELRNLYAVIRFHVSSAENEVRNSQTNFGEVFNDFISTLTGKIEYRLTELNQQIDFLEESIHSQVSNKVEESINSISELLMESSALSANLYLKSEIRKNLVVEKIKEAKAKVKFSIRKMFILTKRNYRLFFKEEVENIFIRLKLKKKKPSKKIISSLFLNESKLNKLPFIYRKLFDGSVLESNDFLVSDHELNSKIESAIADFIENKNSSTILVGGPGSGKSTMINSIKNNFLPDYKYVELNLLETVSTTEKILGLISRLLGYEFSLTLEEIILALNDPSNKRVIILNGIEKLYLRRIGGYEALKTFSNIVSSTSKNTLWICTSGKYAWKIFSENFGLSQVFQNKVFIDDLQKKSTKLIIESRHNATGYGLKFVHDDFRKFRNKIIKQKDFMGEQAKLSHEFYNRLEEYSEGNISSAIFYWLQSIKEVQENVLIIGSPKKIDSELISELSDFYFLTISEVLNHGLLTANEHSQIFNISLDRSVGTLQYLESINLLNRNKYEIKDSSYFINKFLFKLVEKELVNRNMV